MCYLDIPLDAYIQILIVANNKAAYVNGQAWAVEGTLSARHSYVLGS